MDELQRPVHITRFQRGSTVSNAVNRATTRYHDGSIAIPSFEEYRHMDIGFR